MFSINVKERKETSSLDMGSPVISSTSIEDFLASSNSCNFVTSSEFRGMEDGMGYPILEDRIYFLPCQDVPDARTDFVYFSTDDVYTYHPFCDVMKLFVFI
jgi:hypothetical protein